MAPPVTATRSHSNASASSSSRRAYVSSGVRREDLLVPAGGAPDRRGCIVDISPETAGWQHVGFRVYRLARGERVEGRTMNAEECVVLLSGRCRVLAGSRQ